MADQDQDVSQDNYVDSSDDQSALSGAPAPDPNAGTIDLSAGTDPSTADLENQAAQNVPVGVSSLQQQQGAADQDAQTDADLDDQANSKTGAKFSWEKLLLGALTGLGGVGPHTRTFGGGLAQGAAAGAQKNQQDVQNAQNQQLTDAKTAGASANTQEANARLGIMHVQQMDLARQYSLAPKSFQDVIDQESMKQGATLEAAGETPVATGLDHNAALAQQQKLMQTNGASPLNVVTTKAPDGTWSVWQVRDANKLNTSPMQVTVGMKPGTKKDGSADYDNPVPVTVTAPAGTISIASALASPVAAASNFQQQRAGIEQKKQEATNAAEVDVTKEKALLPIKLQEEKAKQAVSDGDPNSLAQLLVNGDVAPSQVISSRKPEVASAAFTAAKKLNPNWNAQQSEGYFKAATTPSAATFFGSANSLLDQGGTIDQMQSAFDALPNGKIPAINGAVNWADKTIGGKAPAGFQATALGLADDYSKVMTGGQGSDASRNAVLQSLSAASSPGQLKQTLDSMRAALKSQVSGRIGTNPVMRSMYGQNLVPQTQASSGPKVGDTQVHAGATYKFDGKQYVKQGN